MKQLEATAMKGMNRHRFLKLLLAGATFAPVLPGLSAGMNDLRGDRVGWARLKTNSPIWKRHSESDPKLMRFFHEHTTLNIDPTWYAADVDQLEEMCKYPFLFSQDLRPVKDERGQQNLKEYLRRGGFVLADACINVRWRGDPDDFIAQNGRLLKKLVPGLKVVLLPYNHPLYHCCFQFSGGPPHTEDGWGWGVHGLYAVQTESRVVAVISTSGLQCGWANAKKVFGHDVACMKMLVNIYIYAMMQSN